MDSIWYNKAYTFIRNTYLIPRLQYGVSVNKMDFWKLKNLILEDRIVAITHNNRNEFSISLDEADYYKSIYCEIELFFNKSFIQLQDYKTSYINKVSGSWSLVTLYYFLFFNICCFMRFFGKGYIYLSHQHTKSLVDRCLAWDSRVVKIDAKNYFFELISSESEYSSCSIQFKGVDTTHKVIWSEFKSIIQMLLNHASDEEKIVYDTILAFLNNYPNGYPSALRNDLNYNSETCLKDFSQSILKMEIPKINNNFHIDFLKLSTASVSFENKIRSMAYISSYLYKLNYELSHDFYHRSNFGHDIKKKRNNYTK